MVKRVGSTLLMISLSACSFPTLGQTQEDLDVFSLSLEELLQINVTVATKKHERIIEAPAIVSTYKAEDMAEMGLRTLKDIISFIPGFQVQETRFGTSAVMVRGLVESFNQKVLFLVDDIPYWMPSHSQIPLLGMPIEAISRVEAIRGPGAVIYGTNASAGVIKIVTKKTEGNVVSASIGSNHKRNLSAYYHDKVDDGFISLSAEIQRDDGYQAWMKNVPQTASLPPSTPDDGSVFKSEEFESVLAVFQKGGFNLLAQAYQSLSDDYDEPSDLVIATNHENKGYLLHSNYLWDLDQAKIKVYSDYNRFYLGFESYHLLGFNNEGGFRFNDNGKENYRWRNGLTADYAFSDDVHVFSGAEFETRNIDDYNVYHVATNRDVLNLIESKQTEEYAFFSQADLRIDTWRFLLGARYTHNSQSGSKLTPRASMVYQLDQDQSIKLLYAEGFNVPNFAQTYIHVPGTLNGNPNLEAERVKSYDLAYSYQADNTLFSANAFYLEAKDFIQRAIIGNQIHFHNQGKFKRSGVELDYQIAFDQNKLFANAAYIHQGDEAKNNDSSSHFSSKYTLAVGAHHKFNDQHAIGSSVRLESKRNKAPSTHQVNIDYQYNADPLELFFGVRNVLDDKIIAPDVADFSDDFLIPSEDGRSLLAGLKFHF